jgi:hypothetical protein
LEKGKWEGKKKRESKEDGEEIDKEEGRNGIEILSGGTSGRKVERNRRKCEERKRIWERVEGERRNRQAGNTGAIEMEK